MAQASAGLLLYRFDSGTLEVLLVHPGGPQWRRKDNGAWSIPKGEPSAGELPLQAARREFAEELGAAPPAGKPIPLHPVRQASGKVVHAWAVEADFDPGSLRSNSFSMEWPPRSGRIQDFPEVDRAAWFTIEVARAKILARQSKLLDQLEDLVNSAR